jgi:hypothetical protein
MPKKNIVHKEEKALLIFLQRTKEGDYAPIEESALPYARIKAETELIDVYEDAYYYGIS